MSFSTQLEGETKLFRTKLFCPSHDFAVLTLIFAYLRFLWIVRFSRLKCYGISCSDIGHFVVMYFFSHKSNTPTGGETTRFEASPTSSLSACLCWPILTLHKHMAKAKQDEMGHFLA